jgi:hypothetical protein
VHGAENLSNILHEQTLLWFARKFTASEEDGSEQSSISRFTAENYDPKYSFLAPPRSSQRTLTPLQLKHLKYHYMAVYSIERGQLSAQAFGNIVDEAQVWRRCQFDKTVFQSKEYQQSHATRLSHLACFVHQVDKNAHISLKRRPEVMEDKLYYGYIQFYCVHTFLTQLHMLMYTHYHNVKLHHGLVEGEGPSHHGFQDITVLQHLCAKVPGHGGKTYFVDVPEVIELALKKILR